MIPDPTAHDTIKKLVLEFDLDPYAHLASYCMNRLSACGWNKLSVSTSKQLNEALQEHRLHHVYASWAYYASQVPPSNEPFQSKLEQFLLTSANPQFAFRFIDFRCLPKAEKRTSANFMRVQHPHTLLYACTELCYCT